MKDLTTKEFDDAVSSGVSVIDFWATWCGPCKMLTPILEELSSEINYINFYKVDADENSDLAKKYEIRSIPTVLVIKDGEVIASQTGAYPKVKMRKFILDAADSAVI